MCVTLTCDSCKLRKKKKKCCYGLFILINLMYRSLPCNEDIDFDEKKIVNVFFLTYIFKIM